MEQNEKDVLERYSYKFDIVEKECIPVFLPKIVKEGFAYTLDSLVAFRKSRMSRRINKNMVELQLSNVSQIVFEVTDACNLRCKYCAFGEFYEDYDMRTNRFMSFETGIQILQYFMDHWTKSYNNSYKRDVAICFYGGEPLLNMKFIREIVAFLERVDFQQVNFFYNMTTNAVLLKQNIDFFVAHQFRILVSLDGNEQNHAYRIRSDGSPSFRLVYENLKYVQRKRLRDTILFGNM